MTMREITFDNYFDKVYGCWLGKCIVGTIGAPYEGMKQLLNLSYDEKMIAEMLPNDDLDLQVLWLKVLEERGTQVTAQDLADAFSKYNINFVGEYGYFKRNYDRGICPPYTGKYGNFYYFEGMGCPIRGEIWGLIAPGNPEIAVKFAEMDGTLDHVGDSVYFEQFWSAIISEAFFENDLKKLFLFGLKYLPENSRAHELVCDVLDYCEKASDYVYIRSKILAKYGHCDCTNVYLNMGFIIMSLLLSGGDMIKACMMACNCGFDTDCTAGNGGALMGTLLGAKYISEKYGFVDSGYVLSVDYRRETDRVIDLAKDTIKIGAHFQNNYASFVPVIRVPADWKDFSVEKKPAVELSVCYDEDPYIAPGEKVRVRFCINNNTDENKEYIVNISEKEGFTVSVQKKVGVSAKGECDFFAEIVCDKDLKVLSETNIFRISLKCNEQKIEKDFGIIGKKLYRRYGPFWENSVTLKAEPGESYAKQISGTGAEWWDNLRFYHINTYADIDKEYVKIDDILNDSVPGKGKFCEYDGEVVAVKEDCFDYSEVCKFFGTTVSYLYRRFDVPEERSCGIHIGYSAPFKLYLNGELVAESNNFENMNPENKHLYFLNLKKGENSVIIKLLSKNNCKFNLSIHKGLIGTITDGFNSKI